MNTSATEEVRFWVKVNKDGPLPQHGDSTEPCWQWTATTDRGGYGWFCHSAEPGKRWGPRVRAHRFAYAAVIGPIPAGLHLDHLCRNRACVNPAHLEPVTPKENNHRGILARLGRRPQERGPRGIPPRDRTHCPAGHAYDVANTRIDRHGGRHCRTCHRDRCRARRARQRQL